MVKKSVPTKKSKPTLGEVIMVYTRSSSHWYALTQPEIVTIEKVNFIQGTQVTGKEGHRMEGKRTLVPLEHVASIVEFASEDDLWSEPQPKHHGQLQEEGRSAVLTSHEQAQTHQHQQQPKQGGRHHRSRGRFRKNRHQGGGNRFQEPPR